MSQFIQIDEVAPSGSREPAEDRSLLVVDDDATLCARLANAMRDRGFSVTAVTSVADGLEAISKAPPAFALIDMRLADGNGLHVMAHLKSLRPTARAIMLTGYGNITTAVTAVKLGAYDYLAKPADPDEICAALMATERDLGALPTRLMSANEVRAGHIQEVYERAGKNVSETARRLGMHRRTLQRILAKEASA